MLFNAPKVSKRTYSKYLIPIKMFTKCSPFPFVDILLLLRIQSLCTANEHINTNKLENAYTHKHTPSKKIAIIN